MPQNSTNNGKCDEAFKEECHKARHGDQQRSQNLRGPSLGTSLRGKGLKSCITLNDCILLTAP